MHPIKVKEKKIFFIFISTLRARNYNYTSVTKSNTLRHKAMKGLTTTK